MGPPQWLDAPGEARRAMKIARLSIAGYRCFERDEIDLRDFTVLVGRNSAGKSTVLRALQHFYTPAQKADRSDFHGGWTPDCEIEIAVTFSDLTPQEKTEFGSYVKDETLRVAKVYSEPDATGTYFGFAPQFPPFAAIRRLKGRPFLDAYKGMQAAYGLPVQRSEDAAKAELANYESANPGVCVPERKPEQFFGTTNVGGGKLDNFTSFIFVPAVRDAFDIVEGPQGPVQDLLARVVLPKLEGKADLKSLKSDIDEKLKKVFRDSTLEDLPTLAGQINELLKAYAPGSSIRLAWNDPDPMNLKFPTVARSLKDDGWEGPLAKAGHGLQRSLIIALLQLQEATRRQDSKPAEGQADGKSMLRSVILAIEEPELYLHPSRCRHLAGILGRLAAPQFQILCATHSPHFVNMASFPSVRVVRKTPSADAEKKGPGRSTVAACDENEAGRALAVALNETPEDWTGEKLLVSLGRVLQPHPVVTEGFFADFALLVEGETEVGVFQELAKIADAGWERLGLVVIPCGGKTNMSRPLLVFRQLRVPTFAVFDGDRTEKNKKKWDSSIKSNRAIQILCGEASPKDWPSSGMQAERGYATFEGEIEDYIKAQLGEQYARVLHPIADEFGIEHDKALKSREVAARLVREIGLEGRSRLQLLNEVVQHVTSRATALLAQT